MFDTQRREEVACPHMTAVAQKIEREIRQLPLSDLLAIHQQLVVSIHEKEETEELDPTFAADIERRVREITTSSRA